MTPFEKFMTMQGPLGTGILQNAQDVDDIIKGDFEHLAYALGQRTGVVTEIALTAGIGKLASGTSAVKTGSKVVPKVGSPKVSGGKVLQFKGSAAKLAGSKIQLPKNVSAKVVGGKSLIKGTGTKSRGSGFGFCLSKWSIPSVRKMVKVVMVKWKPR